MYTEQQIAELMGCTVEQLHSNHTKVAAGLAADMVRAQASGKKVRGFTLEQLTAMYRKEYQLAYSKADASA